MFGFGIIFKKNIDLNGKNKKKANKKPTDKMHYKLQK